MIKTTKTNEIMSDKYFGLSNSFLFVQYIKENEHIRYITL